MNGHCVLCLLLVVSLSLAAPSKRPHILIVIADDYGWNDIGYHGSEIKTPNLDRISAEGIRLENYYVQPICTPSRSQLMTGRYQIHTGLQHFVIDISVPNGLPLNETTMAQKLHEQGYSTHMVGKWHLGFFKKEYTPTYRGFESYYGYYSGMEDYFTRNRCDSVGCGFDFHNGPDIEPNRHTGEYSTHMFTKRLQDIVKDHATQKKDKPLFMYMPFQAVHAPEEAPPEYIKPYDFIKDATRRKFAGMVNALDEAVGNITQTYKEAGLWDNTLMVFSTDNGGIHGAGGNNWPLRGQKNTLWEGGLHGVGFVAGGFLPNKGTVNKEFMHISDWFPTLVHLAGGSTDGLELDGHDVWQAIMGREESPRKELLHNIDPLSDPAGEPLEDSPFDVRIRAALRAGDWKIITGDPGTGQWFPPPHMEDSTLHFEPQKSDKDVQNIWLFNIKDDPDERKDLSKEMPDKVKELLERLAYYNSTAVPCRFPLNDPKSNPQLHGGYWVPWEE